jgi:hypothetical protein
MIIMGLGIAGMVVGSYVAIDAVVQLINLL